MLKVKWNLLTFLMIAVTVFCIPSIAADKYQLSPETNTMTGQLQTLVVDDFDAGISARRYSILVKQADNSYHSVPLSFASIPPDSTLRSGDQVTVVGLPIENMFSVTSIQHVEGPTASLRVNRAAGISRGAPSIPGNRNAVVLIVTMVDTLGDTDPTNDIVHTNPNTASNIIQMMYAGDQNVNDLYDASSYGQLTFVEDTNGVDGPDVFENIRIEFEGGDDCSLENIDLVNVMNSWAEKADAVARDRGINLTLYQHRIYSLPAIAQCNWSGLGNDDCGNNCRAWIKIHRGEVFAHELGHNIGWGHSSADLNGDGIILGDEEYGDSSGIMGIPNWAQPDAPWAQANAPHRDQKQWFDAYPDLLVTEHCSGAFELHALELDPRVDTVGTQVVKIPISNTDQYYYLSYRQETSDYPSNPEYANKINIHRHNGLQDPTHHMTNLEQDGTFEDIPNGITVTATSAGELVPIAGVTVDIHNPAPIADFSHAPIDGHLHVQFTNTSTDAKGDITSYHWEIDDETLSTDQNPLHLFNAGGTYTVSLTATDICGNADTETKTIEVVANEAPAAKFSSTANFLSVQFRDESEDPDGNIASREWKFMDDGSVSTEQNPVHTFAAAGTFQVQLKVTDDDGSSDTMIDEITVNVRNVPPTADFSLRANSLSVVFTNTSVDSDGDIVSHQWNFGDNATSTEASPSHTYASPGTYTVQLTVTDDQSESNIISKNVTVDVVNVAPTASFTFTSDALEVQFDDTSTDNDGAIASYQWDFGDGETSDQTSPSHTYAAAGTYSVQLTVTDDQGESNTVTNELSVDVIGIQALPQPPPGGGGGGGGCFVGNLF